MPGWETIKLMQGTGQDIGNALNQLAAQKQAQMQAQANAKSLQSFQNFLAPQYNLPTQDKLDQAQNDLAVSKQNYDQGLKNWEDAIKIQPQSFSSNPLDQNFNPLAVNNEQTLSPALDLENKKQALRDTIAKNKADLEQKQSAFKDIQDQMQQLHSLQPPDWENFLKFYQGEQKVLKPSGSGSYGFGQSIDDRAKWLDKVNNAYIMAKTNPTDDNMWNAYLEANKAYNQVGGTLPLADRSKFTGMTPQQKMDLLKWIMAIKGQVMLNQQNP